MTGHKSSVNALGVYADRTPDSLDDPKQETIAELLRRTTGKSIGVVSDAEIEDATPASVVGHTRRRADKAEIVDMFYSVKPDVIIGGGSAYFLPQNVPGSKRKDDKNYVENVPEGSLCPRHVQHRAFQGREGQPRQAASACSIPVTWTACWTASSSRKGPCPSSRISDLTDSMRPPFRASKNPEAFS